MMQAARYLDEAFRQVAPSLMMDVLLFLGGKRVAGNPSGSDLVREAPTSVGNVKTGTAPKTKSSTTTVNNGATRAAKYSLEWGDASLNEAINRFAPNVAGQTHYKDIRNNYPPKYSIKKPAKALESLGVEK